MVTDFFSIASRISRSVSSRIACFDIWLPFAPARPDHLPPEAISC
jgi:hypothetical protein